MPILQISKRFMFERLRDAVPMDHPSPARTLDGEKVMPLQAGLDAKAAYEKLGGAADNIFAAWGYTSEFLKNYDRVRTEDNALFKSEKLASVLGKIDKVKKCYDYATKVKDALDETKRDGALLKLGIKVSLDIAKKWLGVSLTTHPYYAYHKVMLDALADALNAARNSRAAVEAYQRSVASATSQAVADEFKRMEGRKVDIVAAHSQFTDRIGIAADIARGLMSPRLAEQKIQQYGGADRLATAIADLEAWRAMWAGLSFDSMMLLIMTGNELNITVASFEEAQRLTSKLLGGSSTVSVVAGRAAVNNIEWEKYDQIVDQKKPEKAAMDPIGYAQSKFDRAVDWSKAFAEMCDFVRGNQVYYPSKFNAQLDRLNKVLYG